MLDCYWSCPSVGKCRWVWLKVWRHKAMWKLGFARWRRLCSPHCDASARLPLQTTRWSLERIGWWLDIHRRYTRRHIHLSKVRDQGFSEFVSNLCAVVLHTLALHGNIKPSSYIHHWKTLTWLSENLHRLHYTLLPVIFSFIDVIFSNHKLHSCNALIGDFEDLTKTLRIIAIIAGDALCKAFSFFIQWFKEVV